MDANTLTSEPKTSAEVYGARATTFPSESSRLMSVTSSTRTSCSNPCKNASTRLVRERPRAQSTWQEASTSGLAQGITSAPERPMQNFSRACFFRPPAPAVHAALVWSAPRNSVPTGTAQFPWSPGGKALLNSHRRPACRPSGKLPSTLANATHDTRPGVTAAYTTAVEEQVVTGQANLCQAAPPRPARASKPFSFKTASGERRFAVFPFP